MEQLVRVKEIHNNGTATVLLVREWVLQVS